MVVPGDSLVVAPPPPVPSVSCTQFPQGCPCSASVIKASAAWLLPLFSCPGRRAEPQTGRAKCGVPQRHHQPAIDMRAESSGRQLRLFVGT